MATPTPSSLSTFVSRLFGRQPAPPATASTGVADPGYAPTQFIEHPDDSRPYVPWSDRAIDLAAQPHDAAGGAAALVALWTQDRALATLGPASLADLAACFEYIDLAAGKRIFSQDEQGDYLLVVLQGAVAEERAQPSGGKTRLGESGAGDLLGELSALDGGMRFCSCTALSPVTLAVLPQISLDRLMADEPRLAAALLAWIAKRLSLRLRQVSARLSVLLTRLPAPAAR
jgi:CRP/FNR family transcriptional regulator, cyclic AMP receptor protein